MRVPWTIRSFCTIALAAAMGCSLAGARAIAQSAAPPPDSPGALKHALVATGELALPVPAVPGAYADLPYRSSVRVQGGTPPYTMTVTGDLPDGVGYDTGADVVVLRGVPATAGSYSFDVAVVDAASAIRHHSYVLEVHPRLFHPEIMQKNVADAETLTLSDAISVFFPVHIGVPEVITISDAHTEFSPVSIKVAEDVVVSDAITEFSPKMIKDAESLTISDAISVTTTIGVLPATAAQGTYGQAYHVTFNEVGNGSTPALSYTGSLPSGLAFSPPGTSLTLSGTPTQTGTFPFTIVAKQSNSAAVVMVPYTLVIALASQSITLGAVPSPSYPGSAFSLSASATSGLPVTITSTSALATGSNPFTPAGAGEATFQATQVGNANFAAANPVNFIVPITGTAVISWTPSKTALFRGEALGTGVLDATSNAPGTITYSAQLLPAGLNMAVNPFSALVIPGTYQLTATLTPSDPAVYQSVSTSIQVTVTVANIFVANTPGFLSVFTDVGSVLAGPASGGGLGVAVDPMGLVWSVNANGVGVSKFLDSGVFAGESLSDQTGAAALAIDGAGKVWVASTSGALFSVASATGSAFSPLPAPNGVTNPQSMSIDTSGNLWVVNGGGSSVTELLGLATPVVPLAVGVTDSSPATKP